MNHPSVVFDALARAPPTPIALAMHGDSLLALRTPAGEPYLSRIRSLYLDCRAVRDRDMRPFFELNFPSVQTLRIELHCALTALPANIAAESPARFPKLISLGTSCAGFPLAWVGPSLRMLDISCKGKETQTDLGVRKMHCQCPFSVSKLYGTLGRCPDLEYLSLNTCLPSPRRDPDANSPGLAHHPSSPRLDRLVLVRIADRLDRVRPFLEPFMTIAHRVKELVICTKSPYDDLLGFLPAANRPDSISVIDQVRITVCHPAPDFVHVVQGLAKDADGASRTVLKVHSNAAVPCNSDLDLQRLFRGFAPTFLPTVLVDLGVTLGKPVPSGQSEAWVWLFRHFPKIEYLSLDSASSRDLFAALAQEDVAPALRNLKLSVVLTGAEDWVAEYEEAVSALETRASRGLTLGSLRYRPKVKRGTGELPPPMPTSYVQRIQAVVGQVTMSAPYYTH
ncbi:hypothetical protein OH76DRAFT_1489782 [Lentinus brumalis]|uniref:F-box domain-containing protein n=1 Tax=Lentinus brumalis TaxID=2498619 RepID=A0A371CLB0_9APHY|nr:hypothetical protein OH76DRAFT_1489782 [Polyporus brumalis]